MSGFDTDAGTGLGAGAEVGTGASSATGAGYGTGAGASSATNADSGFVEFGNVRCDLPKGYRPMNDAEKAAYYPGAPIEHAFIDEDRKAVVRFEPRDAALVADEVERRLLEHHTGYRRMAPGFQAGETLKKAIPGGAVGIMSFKSNAPTRDLFNILAVASVGGKEHIALFSCDMKDAAALALDWSRAFAGMRAIDAEGAAGNAGAREAGSVSGNAGASDAGGTASNAGASDAGGTASNAGASEIEIAGA